MIAVAKFGIGAKCFQQSLLQNIFGIVTAQPARVPHQLVAVLLYEQPERRKTTHAGRNSPESASTAHQV